MISTTVNSRKAFGETQKEKDIRKIYNLDKGMLTFHDKMKRVYTNPIVEEVDKNSPVEEELLEADDTPMEVREEQTEMSINNRKTVFYKTISSSKKESKLSAENKES